MRAALRSLTVVPLVVLWACSEPETEVAEAPVAEGVTPAVEVTDPAQVRTEIDQVNVRFAEALNRGDAAGAVQAAYTEDARILPPDMAPIEGRQNIEQFWTGGLQQMGIKDVRLTTDEFEVFGERAYEQGRYQFTTNQGPAQGKYIVVWKRTPEGWRWHRDIWNPSPAEGA